MEATYQKIIYDQFSLNKLIDDQYFLQDMIDDQKSLEYFTEVKDP